MQIIQIQSDDHQINISIWGEIAAGAEIVQICHGLGEHHARYDRLAKALVAAGYVVVAHDHRGHGPALPVEALGHYADDDGWNKVVADVAAVKNAVTGKAQPARWWLLGHSMGSYIAQASIQRTPLFADGLVLSGSTHARRLDVRIGRWVARFERWRSGPHAHSALLAKMSFGSFNKPYEPARTAFDWLSRDPAEVDLYVADPYCGADSSTTLWIDLLTGLIEVGTPANVARVPSDLPVYIVSGAEDPVSREGGIEALANLYREAGTKNLTVETYVGARHELFNETIRDEVTDRLVSVLKSWNKAS